MRLTASFLEFRNSILFTQRWSQRRFGIHDAALELTSEVEAAQLLRFDLSLLFKENKKRGEIRDYVNEISRGAVVSKLEDMTKAVKFSVNKSGDERRLRLQGHETARKCK
ncbi:hypothetical protein L1887_22558 [Cichorium endivia]|nr:hypothetical protein L1887_22558 [Cichorium endivia]